MIFIDIHLQEYEIQDKMKNYYHNSLKGKVSILHTD